MLVTHPFEWGIGKQASNHLCLLVAAPGIPSQIDNKMTDASEPGVRGVRLAKHLKVADLTEFVTADKGPDLKDADIVVYQAAGDTFWRGPVRLCRFPDKGKRVARTIAVFDL
jgi:hypothetical protein